MADIEKVKQGLRCCGHYDGDYCKACPYTDDEDDCTAGLSQNALSVIEELQAEGELLKEYRWIPKEEQMPDEPGVYLVSGGGKVWLAECAFMMGVKGWCNHANNPMVEAWMPVPRAFVRG